MTTPIEVPVRLTCHQCGGRGESWTEPCARCQGTGTLLLHHVVQVTVPAGVIDGDRFYFTVVPRHHTPTRIELQVRVGVAVERHVRLLRILVGLWGGLAMLVGVSMLLLAAGAWAEFRQSLGTAVEFAAGLTTLVFALIGAFALLWGGTHVWAARCCDAAVRWAASCRWRWRSSICWCCRSVPRSACTRSGCC